MHRVSISTSDLYVPSSGKNICARAMGHQATRNKSGLEQVKTLLSFGNKVLLTTTLRLS